MHKFEYDFKDNVLYNLKTYLSYVYVQGRRQDVYTFLVHCMARDLKNM